MTTEQVIGLIVTLLVMCVGAVGSVLPLLPGTPVVLIAAIGHKLYFGDKGAAIWVLVVLGVITGLSLLLDYAATYFGAKKLGATWKGSTGAIVGGLIGLFFNIPGVLLGPFIGALLFEWVGGRPFGESARAGLGATLGLLAGAAGKLAGCVAMMGLFGLNVVWRSVH